MRRRVALALVGCLALGGAVQPVSADRIQTLDGRTLTPAPPSGEFRERQEDLLREARAAREADDSSADAWIWVGRRQAYLGRYEEALETFSAGMRRFPEDPRFLRHRGHRFITTRRLAEAASDFERAAAMVEGLPDAVEPDGLPNDRGIPTSTLQTNIWYHLGLVRYLGGDFAAAAEAWERCRRLSSNPDMRVAAVYWLYLSLRRAGDEAGATEALAAIEPGLDIIENDGYYQLLLAFAGLENVVKLLEAAEADRSAVSYPTSAYGIATWARLNGDEAGSREILEAILESSAVTAFGYIAAEADLARDGAR